MLALRDSAGPLSPSSDSSVYTTSRPRFAIACASHVSFQRFCVTTTPKYMLMERFSFAIWDRNKGITAAIATIWVTNASLLLLGEFSPVSPS
jgi:hypothetical protein